MLSRLICAMVALICSGLLGGVSAAEDSRNEHYQRLMDAVKRLSAPHKNVVFEGTATSILRSSRPGSRKNSTETYAQEFRIEFCENGSQARIEITSAAHSIDNLRVKKGSINIDDMVVFADEIEQLEGNTLKSLGGHVRAWPGSGPYSNQFERFGYAIGVVELNAITLSDLVENEARNIIRVENDYIIKSEIFGTLTISLSVGKTPRVLEYVLNKNGGHIVEDAKGKMPIESRFIEGGEPYASMQVSVTFLPCQDPTQLQTIRIKEHLIGQNGTKNLFETDVSMSVRHPAETSTKLKIVDFESIKISDDSKVYVFGNENVRFEINNGRIYKVLDDRSLKMIEKLSKPKEKELNDVPRDVKSSFEFPLVRKNYLRTVDTGSHCGAYSLMVVLSSLQVDYKPESLLSSNVVDSPRGSSATAICDASKAHRIDAFALRGMSRGSLAACKYPTMILLDKSRTQENSYHWVVCLKVVDGNALIVDAPREPELVDLRVVEALWSGDGIVFVNDGQTLDWLIQSSKGVVLRVCAIFLFVITTWLLMWSCFWSLRHRAPPTEIPFVIQLAAILVTGFLSGFVYNKGIGFSRDSDATNLVIERLQSNVDKLTIKTCSESEVRKLIRLGQVQIVDARLPRTVSFGAIDDSVNFPIDASLGELQDALHNLDRNKPTVVYCQNRLCSWDTYVAMRLLRMGFENVRIMEIGWDEWRESDAEN